MALLAHWPANDGAGTTLTDVWGSYDGTLSGSITWDGTDSLNFPNGSHSGISIMPTKPLNNVSAFTIAMWINHPAVTSDSGLFYTHNHFPLDRISLWLDSAATDGVGTVLDNGVSELATIEPTTVPINTAAHIAFVYDGSFKRVYLNGVALGGAFPAAFTGNTRTAPGSNYWLGNDAVSSRPFIGKMWDICVRDDALSPAQITDLFTNGVSEFQDGGGNDYTQQRRQTQQFIG